MSEEKVTAEVAGLQISNNTFTASPPGSLSDATNAVMPQKGVIEPVRGQERYGVGPSATDIPWQLVEFQGHILMSYAASKTSTSYGLGVVANPTTGFSGGPYNPVDDDGASTSYGRMRFGFGGSYVYFCTTTGPKALEAYNGTPRDAGLIRMSDAGVSLLSPSSATGWLPYGSSVAYRTLHRKPTTDGTSVLSPPSGRVTVTNRILVPVGGLVRTGGATVTATVPITWPTTGNIGLAIGDAFTLDPGEANFAAGSYTVASVSGNTFTFASAGANVSSTAAQDCNCGARAVAIRGYLPPDAASGDFERYYRSVSTTSTTVPPSDEMFEVYEAQITNTNVSNGYVDLTDTAPESTLSNPLYTNPQTGEGIDQADYPPPLYRDCAYWDGRMWYTNTTARQQFDLQMLGVGSPAGVQNNDTIVIGYNATDYTVTFKTTLVGPGPECQIVSSNLPSSNIQLTTQNLIIVYNNLFKTFSVPIRLYYNSSSDEAQGKILIQQTQQGLSAFTVKVSRAGSWSPGFISNTAVSSTAERLYNGLYYSKLGESEAVPLVNYLGAGSKNYPIGRIVGLQNALLVFKEGDGIYAVSGPFPYVVRQVSTANIVAPDACAVFADAAWVYTDQGILRVSDSGGATVVSRQIETELNRLRALLPDETFGYSIAVPYETERRIMFFVPVDTDTDTGLPVLEAYCYNNATQAWTGPLYSEIYSGVVGLSSNKLYLGEWDSTFSTGRVTEERKTQTVLDYAGQSFSNTISAVDVGGDEFVITLASTTGVAVGDGISQGNWRTRIAAIDGSDVTLYESVPFTTASCTIYRAYPVSIQFQPAGSPSSRKTLSRLSLLFKPEWFENVAGLTTVLTDQIQAVDEIETTFPGFGSTSFGVGPFGNPTPLSVDVNPIDPLWTNAAQFFVGFELNEAWPKLRLQGYVATLETAAAPAGRGK